jgi:RNA polymerase sigma-70 factor (sigma-E family)
VVTRVGEHRIAELYWGYAPDAIRLAYLLTGDQHAAADIVQEAFVRLFGRFHDLRQPEAFGAYLRRTIVNPSKDRLRWLRSDRARPEREGILARTDVARMPDIEGREVLRQAIRALPHRQRAALVLRYYEDLPERDIAEALRCSVPAVKSLLARGTRPLREPLSPPRLTSA